MSERTGTLLCQMELIAFFWRLWRFVGADGHSCGMVCFNASIQTFWCLVRLKKNVSDQNISSCSCSCFCEQDVQCCIFGEKKRILREIRKYLPHSHCFDVFSIFKAFFIYFSLTTMLGIWGSKMSIPRDVNEPCMFWERF